MNDKAAWSFHMLSVSLGQAVVFAAWLFFAALRRGTLDCVVLAGRISTPLS